MVLKRLIVTLINQCNPPALCVPNLFIAKATDGLPPYTFTWFDGLVKTNKTGKVKRNIVLKPNQSIFVMVTDATSNQVIKKARTKRPAKISQKDCK